MQLYKQVGKPWLWWLRQIMPDDLLERNICKAHPSPFMCLTVSTAELAGFFETDAGYWPDVNLNYFGLVPEQIGKGLGRILLDAAVDSVFLGSVGLRGHDAEHLLGRSPKGAAQLYCCRISGNAAGAGGVGYSAPLGAAGAGTFAWVRKNFFF